jgi:hypothetical protein
MTMLAFDEIADAIARKLVAKMTDFELEEFVQEHYTEYYANDADEDEIIAIARDLGIEVEDYIIGG